MGNCFQDRVTPPDFFLTEFFVAKNARMHVEQVVAKRGWLMPVKICFRPKKPLRVRLRPTSDGLDVFQLMMIVSFKPPKQFLPMGYASKGSLSDQHFL